MSAKWSEENELYKNRRKQWEAYEGTLTKHEANWDRGAKRPPPQAKPPEPKPKTKPKKKPVPVKSDVVLEDIEFITPPMTPLPPLEKPPLFGTGDNVKDDEFWEFYDQPVA